MSLIPGLPDDAERLQRMVPTTNDLSNIGCLSVFIPQFIDPIRLRKHPRSMRYFNQATLLILTFITLAQAEATIKTRLIQWIRSVGGFVDPRQEMLEGPKLLLFRLF
jgi:hypothetical protein